MIAYRDISDDNSTKYEAKGLETIYLADFGIAKEIVIEEE